MVSDRYGEVGQNVRSVEDSARLLKRLYLIERELLRSLGAWHLSFATWALKTGIPRDWWQDSLHADALRSRVLELRYPKRDVDSDHDPELVAFLGELTKAANEVEFTLGIYQVVKPALIDACRAYIAGGDAINDAPSFQQIRHILIDDEAQLAEIAPILDGFADADVRAASAWINYLRQYLHSIGGLLGDGERTELQTDHECAGRADYAIPTRAVRDPRFLPAVVESPGRRPQSPREEQIWVAIDHANEVWAAEVPGAMMWHFNAMPWQFYLDVARWGYDEMRHALMGMRRLDCWGFEMGVDYPMVGDPYHAVLEKGGDLFDVVGLLYYFEREAPATKQREKARYDELGDIATAQDTDFDWADEAIHLRYGYTWLNHFFGAEAREKMEPFVQRAGEMWETWLKERWERGEDGYAGFMERIEAKIANAELAGTTS